ncbi:UDP-glycosyltransferase 92A1 [Ricinus communis]|uniref:Glycosyltransferase n=1 Tax=Ricinus communis TaxID=3988 RepID=B9RI83_RICCO|nr:UDP-glycosyltransferase 92A1 [Ricinus communis]EEF48855.1 UDP-glucosyltransferase, putative [Ricinus communis]|eukprot:XP_002513452.1 UDP-glycosyltransferase 92A1 [Ricinus communis]
MAPRRENIVMFPFMAQGHIIPFLALAFHIEQTKKYKITFVNTPLNIKKLKSSLPPNSSIRLLEIPFDSCDHGLPPNTENTDVLSYPRIIQLLHASTSLEPAFKKLILDITNEQEGEPPLCIIADIFFGWTATVAKELGVFHAIFSGAGGFGLAVYYSVWSSLPHRNAKSDEFELQDFQEVSKLHLTQLPLSILEADGTDSWSVFQRKNLSAWFDSNGILFNTVQEFDHVGLSYFRRKLGRPAWAVGPVLLSMENRNRGGKEAGISPDLCKEWLDNKPVSSVLYVSFGSHNTISPSQMMQLALGLEASGRNFIWVVRPPIGFDINSEFRVKEWLPEGFEERIKESGKGLLVHKWASQVEILSHKSTCAFLSHCGWNSVLESLNNGVPLIGWAMAGEQFFNVKFLEEELGVCVEVARGKTCEVRYEDIKDKIELVMSETGKGEEIKRKALEVKEMIKNAMKEENGIKGSSLKALEDFFQAAMSIGEKTDKNFTY